MTVTSEAMFERQREEAQEWFEATWAAIDDDYQARLDRLTAEETEHRERLKALETRVGETRQQANAGRAVVGPGLGRLGISASMALGLAGSAGAALVFVFGLARFEPWTPDATRTLSSFLASLQHSVAATSYARWVLSIGAGLAALLAIVRLAWHRPWTWLARVQPAWAGVVAGLLLWVAHWPVGIAGASAQPLLEGFMLASTASCAWLALTRPLRQRMDHWWYWSSMAVVTCGLVFLIPDTWSVAIIVLAVVGSACVERVAAALANLHKLRSAENLERVHAPYRRLYERLIGVWPRRPRARGRRNLGALAGADGWDRSDFPSRREALRLERNRRRLEARSEKDARLRELDYAQVLHGRYYGW